jgi:FkbM family methyltransferase
MFVFPAIYGASKCRYGQMVYPARDEYIGRSLLLYGEFSEGEANLFKRLVNPGDIVLDVGANIGAHTVLFARLVGQAGAVLAFEPQPVLFQTLCANLTLNNIVNVRAEKIGLGNKSQTLYIPILDYGSKIHFGGLSLDLVDEGIAIPVKRLDTFGVQQCALLKIDVEGMEHQVIEGGATTIYNLRPLLYVGNDRREKSPALIQLLLTMGYSLWWHVTPLYNENNFTENPDNVFGSTVSINMLCIPNEKIDDAKQELVADLTPVTGPTDWWRPQ